MSELINSNEFYKDLPQLIVSLDSLDESANYIHIADAKENVTYYCPCCKGIIKPRACIHYNNREKRRIEMETVINNLLEHFQAIMKNSIWEIKEKYFNNFFDTYDIEVGIKNGYDYQHKKTFIISCEDFDDINRENIYSYMVNKLSDSMIEIRNFVNKHDGENSQYRHIIVNKETGV